MRLVEKSKEIGITYNKGSFQDILEKLYQYEELEEQGLLLRLPCKAGDTVYKLWYKPCHHGCDYPDSYDCCGCMDECDLEREIFEFKVPSQRWIVDNMDSFGECVYFLTKEAAEQKLESMKGE